MKPLLALLLLAALTAQAQDADPTQPSPRMKSAMMAKGSSIPALSVKGIVIGAGKKGVVLLEAAGPVTVVARPGVPFNLAVDGFMHQLAVHAIDDKGIAIENKEAKETVLLPMNSIVDVTNSGAQTDGLISYVELQEAKLNDALRMIADQSGGNFAASATAGKTPVSIFLRNVKAEHVVQEICRAHSLAFKKDVESNILRVLDLEEMKKDVASSLEGEKSQVFTLLYPNAIDAAIAIADIFGDRVELSLGNEDLNDDARDLQSRFNRFNVLGQGNLAATAYQNSSTTYNSNGGVNVVGAGGAYGMNQNGGFVGNEGTSNLTAQRLRNRELSRDQDQQRDITNRFLNTSADMWAGLDSEAKKKAYASERLAPSIYVTASRRNNTVVVRTADSAIMQEISDLIRRLDVPTPLVMLEVKVLRVSLGNGFESAFDYQFADGNIGGSFTSGSINPSVTNDPITNDPTGVSALPTNVASTGLRDGHLVFQYLGDTVRARLQLLESKNRLNTIASPTLLTAHNEVSRLFLGEERPLVRNISSQTILTDNNAATTPNTQIEFRSVGTTLLITPNINSDRTVTLRLLQENSAINRNAASIPVVTSSGPGGSATGVTNVSVDTVASRSVSGTFAAADGKAVIVGGLIEDQDEDQRAGVPVLSRVPVLGLLFRRQDTKKGKSEMIIIIRPHILSTPADGEKISQDLLHDLSDTARQRLQEAGYLKSNPLLPPPSTQTPVVVPRAEPAKAASPPAAEAPSAGDEKPKRRFFWQKK